jgi:hypothetical protein
VKVWPATVIVPVRAAPESTETVKLTVPSPEPLAPLVIVTQLAALVATHGHDATLGVIVKLSVNIC